MPPKSKKKGKAAPLPQPPPAAAPPPPPLPAKPAKADKKKKKGKKEKVKKAKDEIVIKSYFPTKMKCPLCKKAMTTRVVYVPVRSTLLRRVITFLATCIPCVFCVRATGLFRDATHYCTKCGKLLAKNSW